VGRIRFTGSEFVPVKFAEENTNHKASLLVAIDERMVADHAGRVQGGESDDVPSSSRMQR
jgi:hypothetical protein